MVQSSFEDAALFSGCNWRATLGSSSGQFPAKSTGACLSGRLLCSPSCRSAELLLSVGQVWLAPLGQCFDKMLDVPSHRSTKGFAAKLPDLLLLTGRVAFLDSEFYGLGTYILAAGIKQCLNMHCQIWSYIEIVTKDIARNIAGREKNNY